MRENSKRSAPRGNSKLTRASAPAKQDAVSEFREISPVASLGQINNIESDRAGKLQKECSWEQWQLTSASARLKTVAVLELREIAPVASLGQINNIRKMSAN